MHSPRLTKATLFTALESVSSVMRFKVFEFKRCQRYDQRLGENEPRDASKELDDDIDICVYLECKLSIKYCIDEEANCYLLLASLITVNNNVVFSGAA